MFYGYPDMKEKRLKSSSKAALPIAGFVVPLLCGGALLPGSAVAMQTGNTEATLSVTLSAEQDDNVTLASDTAGDEAKEDELVFHVAPALDMTHFINDHNLNFMLNGDYRKGADIVDGELNLEAGVGMDFNFAGGLMISLSDTYENQEFDQWLYTEAGVSENQKNTYGVKTAYNFGERTSVEAEYAHLWEEYDDEPQKTVYDTDRVNGRVTIPVSTRWKSYVAARLSTIDSEEAAIRNNDDVNAVLGFRWEGPSRLACWIEGGFGEIDYEYEELEDYSNAIGEAGMEVAFTPWSFLQASVGGNSYGNLKYSAAFMHSFQDKVELTLGATQDTLRSYALRSHSLNSFDPTSSSFEPTYDATSFRLALKSTVLEKIEAGLSASYQIYDRENSVEILVGKATLDYPIQDWIKAGAHYQYATRTADNADEEYDDNRIGLFVTLSL